jgi:hypothetical protein
VRWFLDTEFNENGKTIELISIALVSEDGQEYYAVSSEFNAEDCNDWVKANVLTKLPPFDMLGTARGESIWKPRDEIANEIRELVLQGDEKPEFWAYFADYDWVALCQLYGAMVDLPPGFPMFCLDLKQEMYRRDLKKSDIPIVNTDGHSALSDAKWNRSVHRWLHGPQTTPWYGRPA